MIDGKDQSSWKKKPVVFMNNEENNQALIERLEKSFQVQYSSTIQPFSCFFPSSSATFLLVDFASITKSETKGINGYEEIIEKLAQFVSTNVGSHVVYLHPHDVDDFAVSVFYEVQRSVEVLTQGKLWTTGFATSWKKAVMYMTDVAQGLSLHAMDKEDWIFEEDEKLRAESAASDAENFQTLL